MQRSMEHAPVNQLFDLFSESAGFLPERLRVLQKLSGQVHTDDSVVSVAKIEKLVIIMNLAGAVRSYFRLAQLHASCMQQSFSHVHKTQKGHHLSVAMQTKNLEATTSRHCSSCCCGCHSTGWDVVTGDYSTVAARQAKNCRLIGFNCRVAEIYSLTQQAHEG